MTPELARRDERGSLLAHVPFHYVPHRWKYLERVIAGLADLDVDRTTVVVDSNTSDVVGPLGGLTLPAHCEVRVAVHPALPHPFDLTWAHREDMAASVESFDHFMYLEDDIHVPRETFAAWRRRSGAVDRAGFVHGFLRVEQDARGAPVASDWREPLRRPVPIEVEGTTYVRPDAFYQACWVYSRETMRRFLSTEAWTRGFHPWASVTRGHRRLRRQDYVREFSAFGMACARPGRPRVLLPLDEEGQIARDAWVWHLPNNYADNPHVRLPGARNLVGRGRRSGLADPLVEGVRWAAHLLRVGDAARWLRARGTRARG